MPPQIQASGAETAPAQPNQPNWPWALRGLWALTWKSQVSWRRLPIIAAIVAALPALTYATLRDGQTEAYFHWVVDFYLFLLLPLYCLSICGALIRDELQGNTLGFLTTRPLSRARMFLLKYCCHTCWLQLLAFMIGVLLLVAGWARGIEKIAAFAPVLLGLQVLAVFAYGALSAFLGLVNQRYMVLGILYGLIVELGIGQIPTNINNLSLARHGRTILANHEPLKQLHDWSSENTLWSVGLMVLAALVFLAAGALLFTFREYHASEEMQK